MTTTSVVLLDHLLPLPQIILQQVPDLPVGVAVSVAALVTDWVAAPAAAVAAAVAVVTGHGFNSRGTLAVMAGGVLIPAALKAAAALLADVVCSSAGLNVIVQLKKTEAARLGPDEFCFISELFFFFLICFTLWGWSICDATVLENSHDDIGIFPWSSSFKCFILLFPPWLPKDCATIIHVVSTSSCLPSGL